MSPRCLPSAATTGSSALLLLLVSIPAAAQSILSVAGGGSDDGGVATRSALVTPVALAADSLGNVFIADSGAHRIRRVDAWTGVISTLAGNGARRTDGDGGPATLASIGDPAGVAIDGAGNVYFSDAYPSYTPPQAGSVRRIDVGTGIVTTVAGGGTGPLGDGGSATRAYLDKPTGLAVDAAGTLYVSDSGHHRVRAVSLGTGTIRTVAGTGSAGTSGDGGPATLAGLWEPAGLALGPDNALYIAEAFGCRVRRVDLKTGTITTAAGNGIPSYGGDGGLATAAAFNVPRGVAIDSAGGILVADTGNYRLRRIDPGTRIVTTVAGTGTAGSGGDGGPASAAQLDTPMAALATPTSILVASSGSGTVRAVSLATGVISPYAGTGERGFVGDGRQATMAGLSFPSQVSFGPSGDLFIADAQNNRVRRIDSKTGLLTTVAGNGSAGVAGDGGAATQAQLQRPYGVLADSAGNLFIADSFNLRIRKVDGRTGLIETIAGTGASAPLGDGGPAREATFRRPDAVAQDSAGNLYIADSLNNRIRRIDARTQEISTVAGNGTRGFSGDGGLATGAMLDTPTAVFVDAGGSILIADQENHRVRQVTPAGIISTIAGSGSTGESGGGYGGDGGLAAAALLKRPTSVYRDAQGNVYIIDNNNNRVRRVDAGTGRITTIAGSGVEGLAGDGGPATSAALRFPVQLALTGDGDLVFSDSYNNRVRAIPACRTPGSPGLLSPSDGALLFSSSTPLSWQPTVGGFSYDVLLDTVNPPAKRIANGIGYATAAPFWVPSDARSATTAQNLNPGTTYYWRVVAKGDPFCPNASTASSTVRSFIVSGTCTSPGTFSLLSPASGATSVASTSQLTWQSSSGASTYDVYVGTSNPPGLVASGVSATSYGASGLAAGATYYWNVVAHASCDPSKTTSTGTQSFTVAGTCAAAGAFSQTSPSSGASGIPTSTTLTWTASTNASAYDVYLGSALPPALYAPGVSGTSLAVSGLTAGATYSWKVIARVTCGQGLDRETSVQTFTVAGTCTAPQATTFTFVPPGGVSVGQTYAIAWKDSPGVDAGGGYLVERSTDISFPASRDTQRTTGTSATFVASSAGTYYHRIRPVAGCGAEGNNTFPAPVQAVPGAPNIVFTVQPSAVLTALGDRLEDQKTTFTLENISKSPVTAIIGTGTLSGIPFFTVYDPLGQSTALQILEPRKPKTFEIRFSGPPADKATSYEGIVSVAAAGLPVVPYAFVNLKVGGSGTSAPVFKLAGAAAEYASFSGYATKGDETLRPPLSVEIQNPGNTPMELGAEIGPELWLVPEQGWNATAIQPNSSRTVRFTTRRTWAPNGSALPRYTYFTLRTKSGQTARLLVQDNDTSALSQARTSQLDRSVRAYLIPSVAHVGAQGGGSFISRVRLSNTGTEEVQADLLFTPSGSDGFDPVTVKKATVIVPKNDLVNLTDPLVQLFGLEPPVYGTLEVRAAAEKIGFLTVTSGVDAPAPTGGSYGFQMPVAIRGEGARLGTPHLIPGITATTAFRTNLILAETTGIDGASVRVTLYDNKGTKIGDRLTRVPRYGQEQISNVVPALGGGSLEAARLELTVESGGGSVVGVVTVIDSATLDAASYASQPGTTPPTGSFLAKAMNKPLWSQGAVQKATLLVPSIVNGFASFKGRDDLPYTFKSLMGFTSGTLSPATFTVTYKDQQNRTTTVKTVTVNARQTVEYKNVVEELFDLAPGAKSQGPVFVEADLNGIVYSKVYSNLDKGSLGDAFPIVRIGPSPGEELLGKVSAKPILIDGLEQSEDETRGTRSNLILTEVLGYPTMVTVSLYEAGNRTTPIAERDVTISALDKVQLSTVFGGLELDTGKDYVRVPSPRRKDRTNVLCVVTARSGEGMVSAVVTTIDNKTADLRNAVLTPTGGVPASGSGIGVGR